ncbi:hypothetical protein HDU93_009988 [Gonapodya sp. JEL0774]|nr:hypothetical protein HDU93_009988 [Gonapodya sp. JEL0774]
MDRKNIGIAAAATAAWVSYNYLQSGPFSPLVERTLGLKPDYPIGGTVSQGYESVREAFAQNFKDGEEVGASFAAFVGGECVVDLWGGYQDGTFKKPYGPDNVNVIYSSGKAVASIVMLSLIDKGLIRWDQKISEVWPEFAQGGKENVTVAELMSHRGGVAWLDPPQRMTIDELADPAKSDVKLAAQPHNHDGVTTKTYHAITRGWYLNAIARRVDPKHRTIGALLREEICPPLGIDVFVGMTPEAEKKYVTLTPYPVHKILKRAFLPSWTHNHPPLESWILSMMSGPTVETPGTKSLVLSGPIVPKGQDAFRMKEFLRCESPSASTLSNGRALATLGALMAAGGTFKGYTHIKNPATLKEAYSHAETVATTDIVTGFSIHYTKAGFAHVEGRKVPDFDIDPVPSDWHRPGVDWYGWGGYGGSLIMWCPSLNISVGYVPSALHPTALGDFRSARVIEALMNVVESKIRAK